MNVVIRSIWSFFAFIYLFVYFFSKMKQSYQAHFSIFVLFFSKMKIITKRIFCFHFFKMNTKISNTKTKKQKQKNEMVIRRRLNC